MQPSGQGTWRRPGRHLAYQPFASSAALGRPKATGKREEAPAASRGHVWAITGSGSNIKP